VADSAQLRRCGRLRVTPPGFATAILLVHTRRGVFAVEERCPHRGNSLATAVVSATAITCSMHGWRFDLRSGDCQRGTGLTVRTWPVWLDRGRVWLDLRADSEQASLGRQARVGVPAQMCSDAERLRGVAGAERARRPDGGDSPQ
jgi:nitrite reductase (NADH) small subunit